MSDKSAYQRHELWRAGGVGALISRGPSGSRCGLSPRRPVNRPPLASMTWPVTQRAVSETRKGGMSVSMSSVVDSPWVRRFPRLVREYRPNSGRYEPRYGQVCEASPPSASITVRSVSAVDQRPAAQGLHRSDRMLVAVSGSSTPGLPALRRGAAMLSWNASGPTEFMTDESRTVRQGGRRRYGPLRARPGGSGGSGETSTSHRVETLGRTAPNRSLPESRTWLAMVIT